MIRLPEQTADRIETTKMLIHQRNASQELDEEICNFDDAASTQQSSNQSRRRQRSQSSQRDEESRPRTRTTTAQTRAAARRPMERQIVTIKLRDEFRVETNYTMTKTTPLSNVFELYSERVLNGLCSTNLRFLLDGDRIEPSQTPIMLGVGDEATIDVMFGLPDYSVVTVDPKDLKVKGSTDGVYIRVRDIRSDTSADNVSHCGRITRRTRMEDVFKAYAQRLCVPSRFLRFLLHGERIDPDETLDTIGVDSDLFQIDLTLQEGDLVVDVVGRSVSPDDVTFSKSFPTSVICLVASFVERVVAQHYVGPQRQPQWRRLLDNTLYYSKLNRDPFIYNGAETETSEYACRHITHQRR
jgi:hypothetical protein